MLFVFLLNSLCFRVPLNSDDDTFRDLRDLPISHVGRALQAKVRCFVVCCRCFETDAKNKARECAEFIRKKDELHSIIEIKNYVKKLPSVQAMQKGVKREMIWFCFDSLFFKQLTFTQTL